MAGTLTLATYPYDVDAPLKRYVACTLDIRPVVLISPNGVAGHASLMGQFRLTAAVNPLYELLEQAVKQSSVMGDKAEIIWPIVVADISKFGPLKADSIKGFRKYLRNKGYDVTLFDKREAETHRHYGSLFDQHLELGRPDSHYNLGG